VAPNLQADSDPGSSKIILVVEDSTVERLTIAAQLEKNDFRVEQAPDGVEAMRVLVSMRNMADLVLTDIGMPRMNGINLCRNVKKNAMTKHVPVIMLSGFDDERNYTSAVAAGATDFINKPVSERELMFRVDKVLSSTQRQDIDETSWHRAVFGALADAVVVTNVNDCCIDANTAACELLGFSRDELLHLDPATLSFHSGGLIEAQRQTLRAAGVWRGRTRMSHRKGSSILAEAHMSLTDFDGEPVCIATLRTVL